MDGRAKQIVTALLVVIAVAAIGAGVLRVVQDSNDTPSTEPPSQAEQVVVYYLHGDARCDKCVTMQTYSEAAVRDAFAKQVDDGSLAFREVNYHQPADAHYAEEFGISSPSLIVARYQGGERVGYENLTDIWDLVDDETAFRAYVTEHVSTSLVTP